MERTRERGVVNRQRIVDAADRLFYEQGYNATSFSDIAHAADIPRGNFDSVIQCRMGGIGEMLAGLDADIAQPRARLLALADIISRRGDDISRYGCRFGTLNAELGKTQQPLQDKAAGLFDVFRDWMQRQFAELGFGEESRMLAMHMLACIQGTTLLVYTYKDKAFLQYEIARMKGWIESLHSGD